MQDFCRTCGKTVNAETATNIFSPTGLRLLHSVRTITNCWVENVPGFPVYLCEDCQALVKKVNSFRKRCTKIEAFLAKRKAKQNSNIDISSATLQQAKTTDPLRIEEPEPETAAVDIKVEPMIQHSHSQNDDVHGNDQMSECYYEDQHNYDDYDNGSFDEHMEQAANDTSTAYPAAAAQLQPDAITIKSSNMETAKKKPKLATRKCTMRVGKRTMYIKMTDDQQPKRIVDRERQWASARPCICEHCGRQFKDGSNLNVHLLRHTGTKNYECTQCNEKCYTLHLLRRHQLKHTEGPYECTFCGLQYSTNSSRVRHEREACKKGRAPQSKTELIKRGERTFHCDVCDLWFLRAGNLTQHINSTNHITNERRKNKRSQLKQKKLLNMDVCS